MSNSSVNVAVNKLRDAFGDENRESVLRTVRGSGYAWAVEVVEVPSEPDQGQERAGLTLGDMVPGRMDWRLMQKLYADKDREVWLSGEIGGAGQRVVQVGWTEIGRELLQAEAEAYEALVDVCGVGVDGVGRWFTAECVARLGEAPYVLETEYLGLTLPAWAARQGGLAAVTESLRVKIVAAVASVVDRLHTAGWCHGKLGSECVHLQKTGEEWVARVDGFGHYRSEGAAGAAAQDGIGGGGGWVARKLAGAPRAQEELFEAPELKKWKGEIATPRGDLYALGVLLYQCVACNLTEAPMLGWEQRVEDGVLRSDIAETAHFDPEHRTRRPAELARDLGTLASRRQQEEKLARDRDAAQAAERKLAVEQGKKPLRLALVLAMVIATLVVATMGAVEIASLRRERDRAREEKSEEQAVKLFIERLLFEGDALPLGPITPEQMAERGVRMSQALEGVPQLHAAVLNLLGTGLGSLGRNERAEQVLGEALAERKRTKGEESPEVAETLVALAGVKEEESDPGAGLELATQALAMETKALPADDVALARTRTQIAEDLIALGRGQEAMPMLEGVVAREKGHSELLADLSTALTDLGNEEDLLNNFQASLDHQEQSMRIDIAMYGERHPDIGEHLLTISNDHNLLGEPALAAAEARQAVGILADCLPGGHHEIAAAKVVEAGALVHVPEKGTEAEGLLRDALATLGREKNRSLAEANALRTLGVVERMEKRYPEAVADGERAMVIYRKLYPKPDMYWGAGLSALAETYADEGEWERAGPAAEEALRDDARQLRTDDLRWLRLEVTLARVRVHQGRVGEARTLIESVLGHAPEGDPRTVDIREGALAVWKVVGGNVSGVARGALRVH